jgi:hypothetical protein
VRGGGGVGIGGRASAANNAGCFRQAIGFRNLVGTRVFVERAGSRICLLRLAFPAWTHYLVFSRGGCWQLLAAAGAEACWLQARAACVACGLWLVSCELRVARVRVPGFAVRSSESGVRYVRRATCVCAPISKGPGTSHVPRGVVRTRATWCFVGVCEREGRSPRSAGGSCVLCVCVCRVPISEQWVCGLQGGVAHPAISTRHMPYAICHMPWDCRGGRTPGHFHPTYHICHMPWGSATSPFLGRNGRCALRTRWAFLMTRCFVASTSHFRLAVAALSR